VQITTAGFAASKIPKFMASWIWAVRNTKAALLRRGSYQRKKSRDLSRLLTGSQFRQYTPSMGVSTEGYGPHEERPVAVPLRIDREGRILKHSSSLGFGSGWITAYPEIIRKPV
jgi:hypothetical protein